MLKIMGNNYCQYMRTYFQTSLSAETDRQTKGGYFSLATSEFSITMLPPQCQLGG